MTSYYFGLYIFGTCLFAFFIGYFVGIRLERKHCQKIVFHAYQVAKTGLFIEIAACIAKKSTIDEMKIHIVGMLKSRRR